MTRRTLAAVLLTQAIALAAVAQDAGLRGSSGPIKVVGKHAVKPFSGSLGITTGGRQGYEATLGGTVVEDRLFFFASAQQTEGWQQLASPEYPTLSPAFKPTDDAFTFDGKATAQLGASNTFSATSAIGGALPSSFLSFRFDSVISSNAFFTANFSQRKVSQPEP